MMWNELLRAAVSVSEVVALANEYFARLPVAERSALPRMPAQFDGAVDLNVYAMELLRFRSADPRAVHTVQMACAFLADAAQRVAAITTRREIPEESVRHSRDEMA
jgi:hypothetical protein